MTGVCCYTQQGPTYSFVPKSCSRTFSARVELSGASVRMRRAHTLPPTHTCLSSSPEGEPRLASAAPIIRGTTTRLALLALCLCLSLPPPPTPARLSASPSALPSRSQPQLSAAGVCNVSSPKQKRKEEEKKKPADWPIIAWDLRDWPNIPLWRRRWAQLAGTEVPRFSKGKLNEAVLVMKPLLYQEAVVSRSHPFSGSLVEKEVKC